MHFDIANLKEHPELIKELTDLEQKFNKMLDTDTTAIVAYSTDEKDDK